MEYDMSDDTNTRMRDDDTVSRLLRLAGARPPVDRERRTRIQAAVRDAWRQDVRDRSRTRALILASASLAAAAMIALIAIFWPRDVARPAGAPAIPVARIEVADGSAWIVGRDGHRRVTTVGTVVVDGDRIETPGAARMALRLENGASLRIDEGSIVSLGRAEARLVQGAVYVDATPGARRPSIAVRTPYGTVREIGTQFETRLDDDRLSVRVREGIVTLERDGAITQVETGEELVTTGSGVTHRSTVPPDDPSWFWTESIAPPFDLDGRTLRSFLDWASRETGLTIDLRGASSSTDPDSIVLHGTTRGMTPREAIDAVLPTCGLAATISSGRISIVPEVRR